MMRDQTALDRPRSRGFVLPPVRIAVGLHKLLERWRVASLALIGGRIMSLSRIINLGEQPPSHTARFVRGDRVGIPNGIAPAQPLTVSVLDHIRERPRCAVWALRLLSQAEPREFRIPVELVLIRGVRASPIDMALRKPDPIGHSFAPG